MNERPRIYNPPYNKIDPPLTVFFIFQDVDCMLLFGIGMMIEIEELFG